MKKIISIFLFAAILVNSIGMVVFADNAVAEKWQAAGVIRGDGYGSLGLENGLQRAELVAMINRMFGIVNETKPEYNDVDSGLWYYDEVVAAVQDGYLVDEGDFLGEEQITWAEMLDTIVRSTGISAPVTAKDIAIAAKKADELTAYSVAVMDKRGICQRMSYSEVPTKGDALNVLDGAYTQLFESEGDAIDFTDTQRKYVDDDFSWDSVGGFPTGYYCEADSNVSIKNVDENNYISIDKTSSDGTTDLVKYFPPMTNKMSFEVSLMSDSTSGTKIGPDLKTSVYRDNSSVIKMQMSNGGIYTTDGGSSVRLMDFEAGKWYNVRFDIDLDQGIYDVYINDTLTIVSASVNGSITSGHLGQVHFGMSSGQTGNLSVDNVKLYSSDRTEEAKNTPTGDKGAFTVDFQNAAVGTIPPDWNFSVKNGGNAYIEQSEETPNKYMVFENINGSGNNRWIYNFPSPVSGRLQVDFRIKTDYNVPNYQTIIMEEEKIRFAINWDEIEYFDVGRSWHGGFSGIATGKWYKLSLIIDVASGTYDIYCNGSLAYKGVTFVAGADAISNFWVQLASPPAKLYIDDLKVTPLGEATVTPPEGFETTPRTDVPENSDWMKKYQAAPTGKVVEAEDMTLVNFEAVENANAYNGKAIQVTGTGNASATYTFDGESGDYAIKVGYLENELKKDSTFRVFHNGAEIDYWYGQFDDGLLHVRDVKNKRYIEKGDVFVIEGYDGEDPTTVDYIQFSDALTPKFDRGYLIQEEFHAPGNYARSSWEVSEAGGSARIMNGAKNFGIMDNSTTENVWAKRTILAQNGVVTTELDMIYVTPDDGITMSMRDGEKEIARIITEGSTVYAENLMGQRVAVINGYQKDGWYQCKIVTDIPNKQIIVYNPDGSIHKMPMSSEIEKYDNFYMYTQKDKKGWMKLKCIEVYTGYTVNENFGTYDEGTKPSDWELTGGADVVSAPNADLLDETALGMPDGSTASFSYPKVSGSSTTVFDVLMKGEGTFTAKFGDASFSVEGGDIYVTAGTKQKIWENMKPNLLYYNLSFEQNAETGMTDVYVNNIKKASLKYSGDMDKITFSVSGCDAVVDAVLIHEGIVTSDVPEVNKVDTGDYLIGMQTCDLWHEGEHFGWDCIRQYDNRTPLMGYYDDDSQEVVDWDIKYWAEHGISVYAPCWYRNYRGTPLRKGPMDWKTERFKHSQYADNMNLVIIYENSGGHDGQQEFLDYVMTYWIEKYIKHPSYLKIDNKPVIGIWNHSYFAECEGSDEANAATFEKAEEMLRAEGFDGAIWITNWNGSDPAMAKTQLARGYDFVYYYGSGAPIETQMSKFAEQQEMGLIDGIMSISQGWGAEAWGLDPRKTNLTLDEFRRGLEYTKNVYMTKYDKDSLGARMMLFGNWNEIAEGHMYVPSKLTGFGYLDQVREVFATNPGEHEDIVPENTLDALYPGLWD